MKVINEIINFPLNEYCGWAPINTLCQHSSVPLRPLNIHNWLAMKRLLPSTVQLLIRIFACCCSTKNANFDIVVCPALRLLFESKLSANAFYVFFRESRVQRLSMLNVEWELTSARLVHNYYYRQCSAWCRIVSETVHRRVSQSRKALFWFNRPLYAWWSCIF